MNIKQLEYFISLSETLNFTKSANEAFITQPSFGRQITLLEEEVGVSLFVRSKHNVSLTLAGNALLESAKKILYHYQKGINDARSAVTSIAGQVRIGFLPETTENFLPNFIRIFREKYPNIKPAIVSYGDTREEDDLFNNALDIVFLTPLFNKTYGEDILCKSITTNNYPCIISSKYHWLSSYNSIKLGKLSEEEFILMDPKTSNNSYSDVVKMCDQYGFKPKVVETAKTLPEMLTLVASGTGITIMPGNYKTFMQEDLHRIAIEEKVDPISFIYVWKKDSTNPFLPIFLQELSEFIDNRCSK